MIPQIRSQLLLFGAIGRSTQAAHAWIDGCRFRLSIPLLFVVKRTRLDRKRLREYYVRSARTTNDSIGSRRHENGGPLDSSRTQIVQGIIRILQRITLRRGVDMRLTRHRQE